MDSASGGASEPKPSEPSSASGGTGNTTTTNTEGSSAAAPPSRYESQKRRDWNTFLQYLKNHKPPLSLARCSGAHVIEFLKYLDQFGKTKVHQSGCAYFGHPNPPAPCACPLKQAWGSLDALIGRLRAAYEENGGRPESNPFGARAVRIYLREVREGQARARGIPYEKKKRKRPSSTAISTSTATTTTTALTTVSTTAVVASVAVDDGGGGGGGEVGGSSSDASGSVAVAAVAASTAAAASVAVVAPTTAATTSGSSDHVALSLLGEHIADTMKGNGPSLQQTTPSLLQARLSSSTIVDYCEYWPVSARLPGEFLGV